MMSTKENTRCENTKDDISCNVEDWTSDDDKMHKSKKESKVKSLVDKIEGHDSNKLIKRGKIKISPKSKASPLNRLSRFKKSNSIKKKSNDKNDKKIDSVDLDDDEPRVVSNRLKRATAARQSKIGGIIEAFENNIVVDGALKNNCDDKKDKMRMENAFSKLIRSSI